MSHAHPGARDPRAETAGFPFGAQAARVQRQHADSSAEMVELITSRPAQRLSPRQWLGAKIIHWTNATGRHARLDASRDAGRICRLVARPGVPPIRRTTTLCGSRPPADAPRDDDRCRLRQPQAIWLHGTFHRWANSLFIPWRHRPGHPTTDFITHPAEDHDRRAVSAVSARSCPS